MIAVEQKFSNKVVIRFTEHGHTYLWTPYHPEFVKQLKLTFNKNNETGAEWNTIQNCWIVYTGWIDCENWIDMLISLLNKFYPEK